MRRGFRNKLKKNFNVTVKKKRRYNCGYVPDNPEANTVLLAPAWMIRQALRGEEKEKSDVRRQKLEAIDAKA
jgi:regulatory protein YycI of two-component signal transduction system YycFG